MKWSLSEIFASRLRNYPLLRVVLFLSLGIFVGDKLCDLGLLLNEPEASQKALDKDLCSSYQKILVVSQYGYAAYVGPWYYSPF